jgi:dynamin 1-like protein
VVPAKQGLLEEFQEEVAGKDDTQLRRLINESEEIVEQRDTLRKRLTMLQRAAKELSAFV